MFANNCVGIENLRYFLLFLLYQTLFLGLVVNGLSLYRHEVVSQMNYEYWLWATVLAFDSALGTLMLYLTFWHWFVALRGKTLVEIAKGFYSDKEDSKKDDLDDLNVKHLDQISEFLKLARLTTTRENVYVIFGTWSLLKAVAVPTKRTLPLRGLEWSFLNG